MPASAAPPPTPAGPGWASALGAVAIVLGVFLAAFHGTEWMKQTVYVGAMPADGQLPAPECPAAELREEGLSAAECAYMVEHVRGLALSTPDWFPGVQKWLAGVGALLAFASAVIGGALLNGREAAQKAALGVFGGLALIDLLQFVAVVNAGPIMRDIYLWGVLLWFLIHLMMTAAALAGRQLGVQSTRG